MTMNFTARYYADDPRRRRRRHPARRRGRDRVHLRRRLVQRRRGGGAGRRGPAVEPGVRGRRSSSSSTRPGARSTSRTRRWATPTITDALADAAHRGVKVVVVMTADPEWDGAFDELRGAGVEVRTYPDTPSALYIHAKVVVVDAGKARRTRLRRVGELLRDVASLQQGTRRRDGTPRVSSRRSGAWSSRTPPAGRPGGRSGGGRPGGSRTRERSDRGGDDRVRCSPAASLTAFEDARSTGGIDPGRRRHEPLPCDDPDGETTKRLAAR